MRSFLALLLVFMMLLGAFALPSLAAEESGVAEPSGTDACGFYEKSREPGPDAEDPSEPAEPAEPAESAEPTEASEPAESTVPALTETETLPTPDPEPEEAPAPSDLPEEPAEELPEEPEVVESEDIPVEEPSEEPSEEPEEEPVPVLDGASVSNAFPFGDVPSGAWYADSVKYTYYHQLMNGVSGTSFSPSGYMTRGMVVTVLWRLAGSPAPSGDSGFTDLTQSWYRDAVAWAKEKGVTSGVTATTFQPEARVTREQMTAFLARFATNVRGISTSAGAALSSYPDESTVSSYARAPMAWAVGQGLITGVGTEAGTMLSPKTSATRAQVAAILMRFCQKLPAPGNTGSLAYLVDRTAAAGKTNQIIVVVDHNLTLWERTGGSWSKTLDVYAGYGYNGLKANRTEGDGTTPIGSFPLLYAFGRDANPGTSMEYRKITSNSYFSSASNSTYNTWVESSSPVTGEHLIDYANLQYRYAMVIGFNIDPVVRGKGSAIFLHCKGSTWNTAGCVSVAQSDMLTLLDRVNNGAWIIIVKNASDLTSY